MNMNFLLQCSDWSGATIESCVWEVSVELVTPHEWVCTIIPSVYLLPFASFSALPDFCLQLSHISRGHTVCVCVLAHVVGRTKQEGSASVTLHSCCVTNIKCTWSKNLCANIRSHIYAFVSLAGGVVCLQADCWYQGVIICSVGPSAVAQRKFSHCIICKNLYLSLVLFPQTQTPRHMWGIQPLTAFQIWSVYFLLASLLLHWQAAFKAAVALFTLIIVLLYSVALPFWTMLCLLASPFPTNHFFFCHIRRFFLNACPMWYKAECTGEMVHTTRCWLIQLYSV